MNRVLKSFLFIAFLLCAISISAQDSEWIAAEKTDNIEVFYQFEKSGSNSLEVVVKVINNRTKDIDVVVRISPKSTSSKNRPIPVLGFDIKLTVRAKSSAISKKTEIRGVVINSVKMLCWSNVDAKNKCDVQIFRLLT